MLLGVGLAIDGVVADFDAMVTTMGELWQFLDEKLFPKLFGEEGLGPLLDALGAGAIHFFSMKIANLTSNVNALVDALRLMKSLITGTPNISSPIIGGGSGSAQNVAPGAVSPSRPLVQPSFGGAGFAPGLAGVGADQSVNVSIQGVTINNGMDLAYFEDRVSKAVTRSTRNG